MAAPLEQKCAHPGVTTCTRLPGAVRLPRLLVAFALLGLVTIPACDDDDFCRPGKPCNCSGGDECYLDCEGSGCNGTCHDLNRCGGICDDLCTFNCHNMDECSTVCGAGCSATCHDTVACGIICGPGCQYTCSNTTRCGAEVGDGAEVTCRGLSSCEITCLGSCNVDCGSGVGRCQVWCGANDDTPTDCTGDADCGCP
jgi:hypothetical protein